MAATEVEEPSATLKYKTCVLKVSIHCEGCKRKVNKVLRQVEGVHTVEIDIRQQKVTVVGNVDAETLIKKLTKSRKHCEVWPEKADQKEKKSTTAKNIEKQNDPQSKTEEGGHSGEDVKQNKVPVKDEVAQESAKHSEGGGGTTSGAAKNDVAGGNTGGPKAKESGSKNSGGVQVASESKSEGKKPETDLTSDQSPPPAEEKKPRESDGGAEKAGAGGGGGDGDGDKKKKKKGQNKNNAEGAPSKNAPASTGYPNQKAGPPSVSIPASNSRPHQNDFSYYPPHYYAPPPPQPQHPVHAVSYNTAYPTYSYTTSYYAHTPSSASYAYSYPGAEMQPPPSDLDSYPHQPSESFEMFSDENPNGCLIM